MPQEEYEQPAGRSRWLPWLQWWPWRPATAEPPAPDTADGPANTDDPPEPCSPPGTDLTTPADRRDDGGEVPAGTPVNAAAERDALVAACIELADRLRAKDSGLHRRLLRELRKIGVAAIEPDGQPLDDDRFDVIGKVATDEAERHLIVAATRFAGFTDHGAVLRRPRVTVYWKESA